ncbi:hypothetical protein [Streptomyces sp. H27-D2]|uniref:hypothetical protein n=1 Tax=Streptomyces sp. H27-D2 TaxID=3046304 RepID=UPI002DB8B76D|nr:hypothetical protein [Streptomyces sp. H27-D2]MEC4018273.1 hypothetical protein [Streptomyces sp. H27-D2]
MTEPERDPTRRARQAVQSLRAAKFDVSADAAYDLAPYTRLNPNRRLLDQLEHKPEAANAQAPPHLADQAFASARALDADIRAARIVIHDQLRDPESTLRAVGTDMRTHEGVLLYGEGDFRYVETRLDDTALALDAFSYVRGNGRSEPTPTAVSRRAQAATDVSPARAGASPPQRPAAEIGYRTAPAAPQPARAR